MKTIVLSCEHAVNTIPKAYTKLFNAQTFLLDTHFGIDFGATEVAHALATSLKCYLVEAQASRLLIDCNRSLNHPACFSDVTRSLSSEEKQTIILQYYLPFRTQLEDYIAHQYAQGIPVWHFSIHSFTPEFDNIPRTCDISFLYDPRRKTEQSVAQQLKQNLSQINPAYRIRKNYPYLGRSDGFTSYLRKKYNEDAYIGIELECNQAIFLNNTGFGTLTQDLSKAFKKVITPPNA